MGLLDNILVLDFGQFLSAPSASLRLADMGARVIKIERPESGDICRTLYVSNTIVRGESTIFHAINRNKESFQADLKDPVSLNEVKELIRKADILIHNFRPGVMDRLSLSYDEVKKINPGLIYGWINGFGHKGAWKGKPGQDLLLQAVSGITWLSGNESDGPVPMGVSVADILAGTHLVQGLLSALFQRFSTGEGSFVEVSLLESLLDFQFEVLACFYNDGNLLPGRSTNASGHAYIPAPYGIYRTAEGYLAIAMADIPVLGKLLGNKQLVSFTDSEEWFSRRDEIKKILAGHLLGKTVAEWISILEPADIWCTEVLDLESLTHHQGYKTLEMEQLISMEGKYMKTTRCPFKIDGKTLTSEKGSPELGEHTLSIRKEFDL